MRPLPVWVHWWMAAYHTVIQCSVEHETVNTVWRHRPVYQQHNVLLFCFSSSLRLSNPLLRLSGSFLSEPSLCFPSPCYAFSHLVQSTPRLIKSSPIFSSASYRHAMHLLGHASFAVPLRSAPGFSYAHLCVSCHSISVTLHPLLLSSLPLHGKSHHCRNYSYPLLALPSHFNSIPRLFCSTQSATLPFSSMSYLRYAVSVLTFLRCSVPRPFCSFLSLRISAQFVAFTVTMLICLYYVSAFQCVSMPLPSLSVPLPNSAAHAFPMLICAIPWRIYCSHHLSATYLFISFASLLPTSQVFAVTLHTLRIHCRAMRCQRNSLRSNSDAIPG